jgi:hypothetical protein
MFSFPFHPIPTKPKPSASPPLKGVGGMTAYSTMLSHWKSIFCDCCIILPYVFIPPAQFKVRGSASYFNTLSIFYLQNGKKNTFAIKPIQSFAAFTQNMNPKEAIIELISAGW